MSAVTLLALLSENFCQNVNAQNVELLVRVTCESNMCFLKFKDNGGLVSPSEPVIKIVKCAERNLCSLVSSKRPIHEISRLGKSLELVVLSDLDLSATFNNSAHITDTADGIDNHVSSLVRQIVRFYLNIRKFHIIKCLNLE